VRKHKGEEIVKGDQVVTSQKKAGKTFGSGKLGPDTLSKIQSYFLQPSEERATEIAKVAGKIIDEKTKKLKMDFASAQKACSDAGLEKEETAFVLNHAFVYVPLYMEAGQKKHLETAESMLEYISIEQKDNPSTIKDERNKNTYRSYYISLMSDDGTPLGFTTGAVGSLRAMYSEFFGGEPNPYLEKNRSVDFIGYRCVAEGYEGKGIDRLLHQKTNELMFGRPSVTKHILKELDGGRADFEARFVSMYKMLGPFTVAEALEQEDKSISYYGENKHDSLPRPEKMDLLSLYISLPYGKDGRVAQKIAEDIIKWYYIYYGNDNGTRVIKGTDIDAFDAYCKFTMGTVKIKDGHVVVAPL